MNRYVKKLLCVLLTVTFAFSLASCQGAKSAKVILNLSSKILLKFHFHMIIPSLKIREKIKLNLGGRGWYPETDFKGLLKRQSVQRHIYFSKYAFYNA